MIICYFSLIHTVTYLIVSDEDQEIIHPLEPFKSSNDRLLFNMLTCYVQNYSCEDGFFDTMKIIYNYCKQSNKSHRIKSRIIDAKLLLITRILNHFKIGEFGMCMLDLDLGIDESFFDYLSLISNFSIETIRISLAKDIKNYGYYDYIINTTMSCLSHVFIASAYKLLLFQMEHDRWRWHRYDHLTMHLQRLIPSALSSLSFVFKKNGFNMLSCNLSLNDVLSKKYTYEDAANFFASIDDDLIHIYLVYSYSDTYKAFERYNNSKLFWKIPRHKLDRRSWIRSHCPNSEILLRLDKDKSISNRLASIGYAGFPVSLYKIFFNSRIKVYDYKTFIKWKKDTIKLVTKMHDSYLFFQDWLLDYDNKKG